MPGRRHSAPVVSAIACPAKIVLGEPCHGLSGRQFNGIVPVVSAQVTLVGVIRVADPHMESTRLIEDRCVPVPRFLMRPSAGIGIVVVQCVVQWQRNRHQSEQVRENVQRHHTGRSKAASSAARIRRPIAEDMFARIEVEAWNACSGILCQHQRLRPHLNWGELITVLAKAAQRFPAPELKTQPIMHHVLVSVPTVV